MVLIDSSAWIAFLNGQDLPASSSVAKALRTEEVIVGNLILVEVLQGIRDDRVFRNTAIILSMHRQEALCGELIAASAAANYRLRRRGITVRSTIDCIVATWCLANDAQIIHNDRDFVALETQLGLRVFS